MPRTPDPTTFESGDFVWPKKPGAFVPYNSGGRNAADEDRKRWIAERDVLLRKLRNQTDSAAQVLRSRLLELSYDEFRRLYFLGRISNDASTSVIAVGHVGILLMDGQRKPFVIEALAEKGIVRKPYAEWLERRPHEIVWHGRLIGKTQDERAKIAAEAAEHVDKQYDFWNFNLNDDSGFFCSKLVWLSVFRGLGVAIDGNPNPIRSFWLSPKQILYSRAIVRLHDPGRYANA